MNVMETEKRISKLQVNRVTETLKIKNGQKVADIGAGTGLFSRLFAKEVALKGIVFAVDINPLLLKHIEKDAKEKGIGNIKTVLANEDDPKIPEHVDLIFICDTFHHIENKIEYLKKLKSYLKLSGRIAIVDCLNKWPPFHESMKYTPKQLKTWMNRAGFNLTEKYRFLEEDYFFVIYSKSNN